MKTFTAGALRAALATTTILGGVALAAPLAAQTTTAQLRGQVSGADGVPIAGASVTAVSTGTNQTFRAVTAANGAYALNGLRPGEYRITITGANGLTFERLVSVGVGQSATLDATLGEAAPAETTTVGGSTATNEGGDIVVTGSRLIETRTSEVATNVSQAQIRALPQTDRNFLSFAALAPGVTYIDSEQNKGIQSGASTRSQVNVFIDGISLKNQVLDGGIAGQQDSRGNPFGQLAIGEFRVLTQNYKAEYEQAGAAIVTAVTKSGTNEFHGEAFGQYTDRSLAEKSYIDKRDGNAEPAFKRKQYGVSLGGPIIKDKLFFFGAYEGNDQDRAFNVRLGNRTAANLAAFGQYEGAFVSPFRGDFYFGKLTFTPDSAQVFDVSYSKRRETDIQGFGGPSNTAYSAAENKKNTVDTYAFKWTYTGNDFVNEWNASYLNYVYNPTSLNPNSPTFIYDGVITFGGKNASQRINQQSYTLRDDVTYSGLDGHVFKAGIKFAFQDYEFQKLFYVQPTYTYRVDTTNGLDFTFPAQAQLGLGNTRIAASNSQLGLYAQDDWNITDKLQLNLGLRWDYESNMFNNRYVTPVQAAALLRGLPQTYYFNANDYITDGTDRPAYKKMFQPRAGFSYDFAGDQRTVLFGGYGRYYDRNVFNNTLDEQYRLQYGIYNFYFSRNGNQTINGNPTVAWDPKYLTRDGLLALQATGTTGRPELFAVKNNAKPPVTDQFSIGVRQRVGIFRTSLTGSYVRGRNGYTTLFATRTNNGLGNCCNTALANSFGYANVLIGYDGLDTRYKALFATIDKDYTQSSGWGVNINYTLSKGEQNGGDLFSLDGVTPDAYGYRPRAGDERHHLVISSIVDLPWGFQFSTLSTFGSGQAYQVFDATNPAQGRVTARYPEKNCIKGLWAYCEVNLTLEKKVELFEKHEVSLAVDLFNAFNNKNFTGFDGYFNNQVQANGQVADPLTPANAQNATGTLTLPRRVQFRVGYRF
ncbi:TonB-dependent receptor [Sphingomonas sp. RP10(2022)]|uniref:TonB-dependent receptor n=1 Tax=Sphingomonas liriopis TaxID=2949094 RepID=A0A9X2I1I1_9SPHN|nr:carboxypeptidase regulatory-like domain-containing protein [Sphingomonas liriopis]MCP3736140.1 TonB-dependent receptor [Sphingomonas liriopis]